MTGNRFELLLVFAAALVITQSAAAAELGNSPEDATNETRQQQGMEDNLEDSLPQSDLEEQQGLENPRIVVPENLQELPEVKTVAEKEDSGDAQADEALSPAPEDKLKENLEQFEDELQLESADRGRDFLKQPDRLLEISRKPLTYVQENVPFLTKRGIIFFGRLELDGARYSSGVLKDDNGFTIRRFRLGLAGHLQPFPGWNYKIEFDLTDGENTLSDAYLSWRSDRWGTFRIGNQKVAQTLAGQTSSLSNTFMERPLPVLAFTLQRRIGLGWDTHLNRLGANVTVFAGDPNEGVGSEGWAARGYFNPMKGRVHVFHVGGSFMQLSSDDDARFRSRPESHVTDIRLVDTGIWPEIGTGSAIGLELAGSRGPVTFRSEFYRAEWSRSEAENPQFKGWYCEASWFPTGELANYRDGKFIRPNISSDRGAWEVAVRFSMIDLNDEDIQGGTENNLTLGVNWYSRTHWRLMGNLIKVKADDGPYGKQGPWIAQFRIQYYF